MISAPMMTTPRSTDRAVKVLETVLLRDLGLELGKSSLGQSMVSLEFGKREIIYAMGDVGDGVAEEPHPATTSASVITATAQYIDGLIFFTRRSAIMPYTRMCYSWHEGRS